MSFNYKKAFILNNLWVTLSHILVYAKGIILLPILINTIGISLYGGYSILISLISFIFGISSFGVGFKSQRYLPSAVGREAKSNLFYTQFLFQLLSLLVLCLIIFINAKYLTQLFLKNEVNYSILLVCGAILSTFYYSQVANYFRYTNRMFDFSIIILINPYLNILLIILGIRYFNIESINFLLATSLFSMLLASIPHSIRMVKEIGVKIPRLSFSELRKDLKLGFPIMLSYVLDFILAGSDRLIIAVYMGTIQVGFYNPAYTLGSVIVMFPKIMGVALPPLLSKAVDEGKDNIAIVMLNKSVKFYISLVIPFILTLTILSYDLLFLLANKEVAQNSYYITPIVSLGILFYGLTIMISEGLAFVMLKTKLIFYSNIIAAVSSLLLNFIFLYYFRNILVPAIVSFISYFISFIFIYFNTQKMLAVNFDKIFILKISVASLIMGLCVYLLKGFNFTKIEFFLINIPVSFTVYVVCLIIIKAFAKEEIDFIKKLLFRFIYKNAGD